MGYSLEQQMSKDRLIAFCRKNRVRRLSVFGSALRGAFGPESDIDSLMMDYRFSYARFQEYLA